MSSDPATPPRAVRAAPATPCELVAVLVQYDRERNGGAVERLVSRLEALPLAYRLLVVDNRHEGDWHREVSARLVHAGGDGRDGELSGFARGVELAARLGLEPDVYLCATDAFVAHQERALARLDVEAVRLAARGDGVVGWVDRADEELALSGLSLCGLAYRDWIRTGCFLMTSSVPSRLGALAAPLDRAAFFDDDGAAFFRPGAPLSPALERGLVAWLSEGAHAALGSFPERALGVLREHLFSARLQRHDVPCWDFRATSLLPGFADGAALLARRWQWSGWRRAAATASGEPEEPLLVVDRFRMERVDGARHRHRVALDGWVDASLVGERLVLELEGHPAHEMRPHRVRRDLATVGSPLLLEQAFAAELELELEPGVQRWSIASAVRGGELWSRLTEVAPRPGEVLQIDSPDLRALVRGQSRTSRGLRVRGVAHTVLDDVFASLFVGGRRVDQAAVTGGLPFELRHRAAAPGAYRVRVTFASPARTLYDSGERMVTLAPPVADTAPARVAAALDALGIPARLGYGDAAELAWRLLDGWEEEGRRFPETMLREVVERAPPVRPLEPRRPEPVPAPGDETPLRVLVASWEAPHAGHGGGLYLGELLRALGPRHRVTLVHGYDGDEDELVAPLGDVVERVVSIRRDTFLKTPEWWPLTFARTCPIYVPALREAIDEALASGVFDVVDYAYRWMVPHASRLAVPSVLTLLEEPYSALEGCAAGGGHGDAERAQLAEALLASFHLSAVEIPRRFDVVTTVTAEDAWWPRLGGPAEVYVNGVGVRPDDLWRPPAEPLAAARGLVFLGNYRHRPSEEAALFLLDCVLPRLRARVPDARLTLVGAHPSREMETKAAAVGAEVTGFVADPRPYLWRGRVFVAPLFTGAGMRVKIVEALAAGMPVVTTPLGVRGLGAQAGRDFLEATTVDDIAAACERVLLDDTLAASLGESGARLVRERHSVADRAREREAIWRRAVALGARRSRHHDRVAGG